MTLRQLPEARTFPRPQNFQWDAPPEALSQWSGKPVAAADGADNTISMYDVIGEDWWSGAGVTAKRIAAALRSIGDRDIVVKINSPGGDMFEGIAIYNLLRGHQAKVTVEVLGWAASAASIIAMAGDEIRMGLGSFIMVHKPWGAVVGTDDDFAKAAADFKQFTSALLDIYEARTGASRADIETLVTAETFMGPTEALKHGFADVIDESLTAPAGDAKNMDRGLMARRQTEAALARSGFDRKTRSEMLLDMGLPAAQRDAGRPNAARDAGIDLAAVQRFIQTLRS